MAFGKRQLLTVFLEKDNLKMLAFEISGKSVTRFFGGQISFGADVVREAFIADPIKFSSQVKMAISQKGEVAPISEVTLFIPPEKTFIKAMPATDAIEGFIRSLPYFKEELIIDSGITGNRQVDAGNGQVNHVAFEKKLVEDLERPFLESGKKITAAVSSVAILANTYAQTGKYFFLISFEKDAVVVAMQGVVILDMAVFPKDVFAGRLNEFRLGKNFGDVRDGFSLGVFEAGVLDKIRTEQQLNIKELGTGDTYDLIVGAYSQAGGGQGSAVSLPSIPGFSAIKDRLPNQKFLFLIGAAIVGFVLVLLLAKNLSRISRPSVKPPPTKSAPQPVQPPPAPELKPADFKVRVLNGTKVAGEAGRLGEWLKSLGFDVVETKNATASGFEATRLRTTLDVPAKIIDQVKAKLLETYESVALEGLTADSSATSAAKIEIIIGKKK